MRRLFPLSVFVLGLSWSYQRSLVPLEPILTEEGQHVLFPRAPWERRELSKRLPLDEPWPASPAEMRKAVERFGIANGPARMIGMPTKLATDVYLVGQEQNTNLTYLIDCGSEGVALIDPTFESEFERTLANVEKSGYSRKAIRWVINTHCHFDHSMADRKFHELGAQILIHEADADAIEKGTRVTAFSRYPEAAGKAEFPRTKVDRRLSDGEELRLGNKLLQVIHTPGHTPGSASFLLQQDGKNLLFSGDTVFYDNMLGWQGNPYADNRRLLASLDKLLKFTLETAPLRWDMLLPGHGAISMDHGYLDVAKDRDTLAGDVAADREPLITPHARPEYRARMFGRPASPAKP